MKNTLEEIKSTIGIVKEILTDQIEEILEKTHKMGKNTHEFSDKNAMPPNPVQQPSVDVDININLNIRTRIMDVEFVK